MIGRNGVLGHINITLTYAFFAVCVEENKVPKEMTEHNFSATLRPITVR